MLQERGLTLATMESCTGGLLACTITDVAGSAGYFKGGYVTYTDEDEDDLGVNAEIIEEHGVISAESRGDMARAARDPSTPTIGIGITGIAGPDAVEGKPAGHHAHRRRRRPRPEGITYIFYQGRLAIKRRAVTTALFLLRRSLLDYRREGVA